MFWKFDQAWLADPQNQNSYAYARNNPVTLKDPNGESAATALAALTGARTAYAPGFHESFTQALTDSLYKINYSPGADSTKVSTYTKYTLQDSMIKSKENAVLITSTTRTPEEQARIMYENTAKTGVDPQLRLYGSFGDQVIKMYPSLGEMINKIYQLGPSNVSSHLKDPSMTNVLDIAPSSIKNQNAFINAINSNNAVSKFFTPFSEPRDTSYHIEVPQNNKNGN